MFLIKELIEIFFLSSICSLSPIKEESPLPSPFLWLASIIIKNLIGYTLIIGGILMLVLPGQGLFTILIGLMLSNYPGKFYIERRFIAIPSVLKTINWLRKKSNTPSIKI